MASYCDAKSQQGSWHLRIDNIDPPRELAGASDAIMTTLARYGFEWDGEPLFQGDRQALYFDKLSQLASNNTLFYCQCSRRELAGFHVYPGHCRAQTVNLNTLRCAVNNHAIRLTLQGQFEFVDHIQGRQCVTSGIDIGDPILLRKDGLFSYAFCCAIDDAEQVTHVVRGSDLLLETASQLAIIQALGSTPPQYTHLPIATNAQQQKLSKQTKARGLSCSEPLPLLHQAWAFLEQTDIQADSMESFWTQAFNTWDLSRVPRKRECTAPELLS